jgi:hypothetical protein
VVAAHGEHEFTGPVVLLPEGSLLLRSQDGLADLLGDGPAFVSQRERKVAEVLHRSAVEAEGVEETSMPERRGRVGLGTARQAKRRGKS